MEPRDLVEKQKGVSHPSYADHIELSNDVHQQRTIHEGSSMLLHGIFISDRTENAFEKGPGLAGTAAPWLFFALALILTLF